MAETEGRFKLLRVGVSCRTRRCIQPRRWRRTPRAGARAFCSCLAWREVSESIRVGLPSYLLVAQADAGAQRSATPSTTATSPLYTSTSGCVSWTSGSSRERLARMRIFWQKNGSELAADLSQLKKPVP